MFLSVVENQCSIKGIPVAGFAATATLQQYPMPFFRALNSSVLRSVELEIDAVIRSSSTERLFCVFFLLQQPRLTKRSGGGSHLKEVASTPTLHFAEKPAHIGVAEALKGHRHALADAPS